MDQNSMSQAAVTSAQEMAKAFIPPESAQLKPTVAQAVNVYDVSGYAKRATSLTETEEANNNQVRQSLEKMREESSKAAQAAATARNQEYVQSTKAAYSDNIQINSTVPVVIAQTPETVVNDDAVLTTKELAIKQAKIAIEEAHLDADEAAKAYAALERGDPEVVHKLIAEHNARAELMAKLDCEKRVGLEMMQDSGKIFSDMIMTGLQEDSITPDQLSSNFDWMMAHAGNGLAQYIGASMAGVPNPNGCSTQAVTSQSAAFQQGIMAINALADKANTYGTLAINLSDSLNDIYSHGPELLIHVAETAVQTTAQTALMSLRNAAKTNCNAALMLGNVTGFIGTSHAMIKAGISIGTKAKDLKGSVEKTITQIQKKDFVGGLKQKIKMHPAVREMDRFIKSNKLDLATYSRLTRNGTKFARVMLGSSTQKQLSSVMYHSTRKISSSRNWIRRGRYSTSAEANRYNLFAKSPYSMLEV